MSQLTYDGMRFALIAAEHDSIVAKTALNGRGEWPDEHVDAAIKVVNKRGREVAAEAAFLSTFEGPWGLKASSEDAMLAILEAVRPEFGVGGSLSIYALRGWDRLDGLVDELDYLMNQGLDSARIVKAILTEIDERFES